MDILKNSANTKSYLNAKDFLKNIQEIERFGIAPSATTTCCATGTC